MERKGLPFAATVRKFISRFPGLKFDGRVVTCIYCNFDFVCWSASHCRQHVASKRHLMNKSRRLPYCIFVYDLVFMISVLNIPQHLVDREHFRFFWQKYVPAWKLPTRSQLKYQLPRIKEIVENNIKSELKNKEIWLTVNETRSGKFTLGNVLVRILSEEEYSLPYLISSKRLKRTTGESIAQLVKDATQKFGINKNKVLILVTDQAPYMMEAGQMLKTHFPNLLHVTCLLKCLNLAIENIRNNYQEADKLIFHTNTVFTKAPKRIREFNKAHPGIPQPPQVISTQLGTWLEAVAYYHQHFQKIKSFVSKLNSKELKAIQESQQLFKYTHSQAELTKIFKNYSIILDAVRVLQNASISIVESMDLVESVRTALFSLIDLHDIETAKIFVDTLGKNPDFYQLQAIINCKAEGDQEYNLKQFYEIANITCIDAENLFSKFTAAFTPLRRRLTETTMEGFLMMQIYSSRFSSSASICQ